MPFSADSIRILRTLRDVGMIRGFELQRRLEMSPTALFDAVAPLVEQNLVAASGSLDVELLPRTQFAPLPSARETLESMLKKS